MVSELGDMFKIHVISGTGADGATREVNHIYMELEIEKEKHVMTYKLENSKQITCHRGEEFIEREYLSRKE